MMSGSTAGLVLGDAAPAIRLADADGVVHDVTANATALPLLVLFLCNHCPYVKHIAGVLGPLADEWQEQGVVVVGINSNDPGVVPEDDAEHMRAFGASHAWRFPYLVDSDQDVARAYGAVCTPDIFLFDGGHRLVYRGRFDESRPASGSRATGEDLANAVTRVLAGEPVPGPQHPSMGCSIKWRPVV